MFFFFKQKTAYEIGVRLVGSEMCIRDRFWNAPSFNGAILKASDFPADVDPVEVAAKFWREARDMLANT